MMKFGSLFTGVGGFDLGFERAGMECVWQVEQDKYCNEVLERHYPKVKRYTDVREVGKRNLEPVELICGGFPCQDLSVAGKRAGFDGERSSLWFEFERIINEMRPQWAVIENVPGLLSSKGGEDAEILLSSLNNMGYHVDINILDTQNFNVPQRRRRVFIVCQRIENILKQKTILSAKIILQCLTEILLTTLIEAKGLSSIELEGSDLERSYSIDGLIGKMNLFGITNQENWNGLLKNLTDTLRLYPKEQKVWELVLEELQENAFKATATNPLDSKKMERELKSLNISELWNSIWDESYATMNLSTISTAIKQTTESKIYTCAKIALIMAEYMLRSKTYCQNSSSLRPFALTLRKAYTNYARRTNKSLFTEHKYILLYRDFISQARRLGERRPKQYPSSPRAGEVLFEQAGVSGNFAPGKETGEGTTGHFAFSAGNSSKSYGIGLDKNKTPPLRASNSGSNQVPTIAPSIVSNGDGHSGFRDEKGIVIQKTTGTLDFGGHGGSYNGQDAYQDRLVATPKAFDGRNLETHDVSPTMQAKKQGWSLNYTPMVWEPRSADGVPRIHNDNKNPTLNTMEGGQRQPCVGVRRLTPTECCRLQGFPDDWNDNGLSDIIEVEILMGETLCQLVQSMDVKEKLLTVIRGCASCTISDGESGVTQALHIQNAERTLENVKLKIAIDLHIAGNGVCDTINHGKTTATHCRQKEISRIEKKIECQDVTNTALLLRTTLAENLPAKRLSTISTWTKEILAEKIYIFLIQSLNTTSLTQPLTSVLRNSCKRESLYLRMGNTTQISDTQRYKQMGNAVTVNVIEWIGERIMGLCDS